MDVNEKEQIIKSYYKKFRYEYHQSYRGFVCKCFNGPMYILSSSSLPRKLAREDAIDRVYHRVMSIHKEENKHYKESNNIVKKSIHNTEIKIKKKKSNLIKNEQSCLSSRAMPMIDDEIRTLIDKYKDTFQDNYYTVYNVNLKKVFNFMITKSYSRIKYHGGEDRNGYAQGQLVEELNANIEREKNIFSDISPLGSALLTANVGSKIELKIEGNNKQTQKQYYIVLKITDYIKL